MTKHLTTLTTEGEVSRTLHIDAGWDRPCGHFYLNVEDLAAPEGERLVYASIYDPALFAAGRGSFFGGLTLEELTSKAQALGLTLPPAMVDAMNEDARLDRGNAVTIW